MKLLVDIEDQIAEITDTSTSMPAPPHNVIDQRLFRSLVTSMLAHGWIGAPIVVDETGDALTGSHRIAAALECLREHDVEILIPRVTVSELCAAYGVDWPALLTKLEEFCDSSADAPWWGVSWWAAGEVGALLPSEVVDYLGYQVDVPTPWIRD